MRRASRRLLLALSVAALPAQTQTKHPITAQDLWAFQRVGAPVLSPDGKTAVFAVTEWSIAKSKSTSSLWLVDVAGRRAPAADAGARRLGRRARVEPRRKAHRVRLEARRTTTPRRST